MILGQCHDTTLGLGQQIFMFEYHEDIQEYCSEAYMYAINLHPATFRQICNMFHSLWWSVLLGRLKAKDKHNNQTFRFKHSTNNDKTTQWAQLGLISWTWVNYGVIRKSLSNPFNNQLKIWRSQRGPLLEHNTKTLIFAPIHSPWVPFSFYPPSMYEILVWSIKTKSFLKDCVKAKYK